MNKRPIALLVAIVMIFTMAMPAFAADVSGTGYLGKGDTPVTGRVAKGQDPVYKIGTAGAYDNLNIVYTGNSSSNHGYKVSGNGEKVTIKAPDGTIVGNFVFDKKGNGVNKAIPDSKNQKATEYLVINITNDDYIVYLRWDCSKYYAYAALDGKGTYYLPQLMQDNGKITSFNQVWIGVNPPEAIPEPSSILALGTGMIGMAGFAVRRRR